MNWNVSPARDIDGAVRRSAERNLRNEAERLDIQIPEGATLTEIAHSINSAKAATLGTAVNKRESSELVEKRREKRLRRLAKQKCCSLYKSRVRKTHCNNQGLYMLMNWYTGVVEGPNYEASLDLIEDYLLSH